mmetsp:Transcript_7895/g.24068  ORF Transcript_7895/g.24068 Transcript_7895/m.24068 type:complete len:691 (-) Transcript_7895:18-2090(-)
MLVRLAAVVVAAAASARPVEGREVVDRRLRDRAPVEDARAVGKWDLADAVDPAPADMLRIVYATEHSDEASETQLPMLAQSAFSAYAVGCAGSPTCRQRLEVTVFHAGFAPGAVDATLMPATFQGLRVSTREVDFAAAVTDKRKVWGYNGRDAFIHKLSHAANYFRFYVPKLMWDEHRAETFLYLDTDTLFLKRGSLPGLFAQRAEPPLIVRAGTQSTKNCVVGHIVPPQNFPEKHLDAKGVCLAASVMLVNVTTWLSQNTTGEIERLLEANAKKKLWNLGSMPPLVVALAGGKWAKLSGIADGKGSSCEKRGGFDWAALVHPFKAICEPPPTPTVCTPLTRHGMSPLGSTRIGAMQSNAFVKLTGAKVVNTGCDVAFGAGPTKPVKGAPVKFLFKGNNQESYREAWKDTITVADNGFVDDYFRAKGQPSIRLQLVEDVRPEEMKQAHVPRPDFFGANQTRKPLLCYHGNHMHVHSVLSFVKHIPTPFDLRLIVPDGYGSPASVIKAADASLGSRKCGAGSQSETCVGLEIKAYSAPKIYEKLVHCDVGLSPSEVYPVHDVATLSAKTAGLFQKDDTQPEDMVKRCKRTANAGRAFIFMQLGVPVVVDACPEPLLFANYNGQPTSVVVYRPHVWADTVQRLLANPGARARLSATEKTFARDFLTTRVQARKLLARTADVLRRREPALSLI